MLLISLELLLTVWLTLAVEVQFVFVDLNVDHGGNGSFDLLYSWVTKLYDSTAVLADDVIMLLLAVTPLILGQVFPELMLDHKITIDQEVQGVVNGSPADVIVIAFHMYEERFRIKMVIFLIDLFQNCISLRGLP